MSNQNPFPSYPSPRLTREDVIGYLSARRDRGWEIYQTEYTHQFIIRVSEINKIFVEKSTEGWTVYIRGAGNFICGSPENLPGLDQAITKAVQTISTIEDKRIDWSASPTSTRIYKDQPATNFSKLVGLINTSIIEAVFDPYLDNKGLDNLLTLVSLGASISKNVRLLTSQKLGNRLTQAYLQSWFKELNISGEMRQLKSDKEHRRFMLLSGSQSLIIGLSLNDLSKNEAANIESNTQDLVFFDSEWNAASPI